MASPPVAAGKGSCCSRENSPVPGRVGVFGVAGKGGMEWPIPSPVSLHNAVTCPLPRVWVALKGCHAGTCHRNQFWDTHLLMLQGLSASLIISENSAGP